MATVVESSTHKTSSWAVDRAERSLRGGPVRERDLDGSGRLRARRAGDEGNGSLRRVNRRLVGRINAVSRGQSVKDIRFFFSLNRRAGRSIHSIGIVPDVTPCRAPRGCGADRRFAANRQHFPCPCPRRGPRSRRHGRGRHHATSPGTPERRSSRDPFPSLAPLGVHRSGMAAERVGRDGRPSLSLWLRSGMPSLGAGDPHDPATDDGRPRAEPARSSRGGAGGSRPPACRRR